MNNDECAECASLYEAIQRAVNDDAEAHKSLYVAVAMCFSCMTVVEGTGSDHGDRDGLAFQWE